MVLQWGFPPDAQAGLQSSAEPKFTLQMDDGNGYGFMPAYNGPDRTYTVTGLTKSSKYKFRVCFCLYFNCLKMCMKSPRIYVQILIYLMKQLFIIFQIHSRGALYYFHGISVFHISRSVILLQMSSPHKTHSIGDWSVCLGEIQLVRTSSVEPSQDIL